VALFNQTISYPFQNSTHSISSSLAMGGFKEVPRSSFKIVLKQICTKQKSSFFADILLLCTNANSVCHPSGVS